MKENDRVEEWEQGLPTQEELTPLGQSLITPELASAFSITRDPAKTASDVLQASMATVSTLRRQQSVVSTGVFDSIPPFQPGRCQEEEGEEEAEEVEAEEEEGAAVGAAAAQPGEENLAAAAAATARKPTNLPYSPYAKKPQQQQQQQPDLIDEEEGGADNSGGEEPAARTLKRPRLVWTPQLHKRFVDAVAHLGIKNAVPKTIMQLMNVEGLTRENVASHLQKYRLYLKRMQGLSSEGPSASDHLFASTPVPPGLVHFMAHARDELHQVAAFSPAAFAQPRPFTAAFEHHPYGAVLRPPPPPPPPPAAVAAAAAPPPPPSSARLNVADKEHSPPRQVLTLFPTSNH